MLKGKSKILALVALYSLPFFVHAITLERLIKTRILNLLNPAIAVLTALALLFFVWGLAKFILNAGSEDGRKEGKKVMLWGIIALFILFSFWAIVLLLQRSFFGGTLSPLIPL